MQEATESIWRKILITKPINREIFLQRASICDEKDKDELKTTRSHLKSSTLIKVQGLLKELYALDLEKWTTAHLEALRGRLRVYRWILLRSPCRVTWSSTVLIHCTFVWSSANWKQRRGETFINIIKKQQGQNQPQNRALVNSRCIWSAIRISTTKSWLSVFYQRGNFETPTNYP